MRINRTSGLALAFLLVSPLASAQDTVLYDDFKSKRIDPQKWYGGLMRDGATETTRRIDGSDLRLELHGFADTDRDTGSNKVRNSLYLSEEVAAKVSTLGVEASVKEAVVQGCRANSSSSKVRFRLVGYWFSTGGSVKSSDRTGNVWAQIWIRGKSLDGPVLTSAKMKETKTFDVAANVYQCGNATCSSGKNVFTKKLGTVKAGQKTKLSIDWDELSNQFVFKKDREVVEFDYSSDLVNDGAPTSGYYKGVQVATDIERCDMSKQRKWHRPSAYISAKVDDVRVNADYKRDW